MKKIILLLCLFLLTSCDSKELSELSIGTVLGVDQSKDGYIVSCLVVGKEENKTLLYTGEGSSIGSALSNLNLNLSENLYLDHIQSVVLSDKVAEKGMKNLLTYFLKEKTIQKNFYLFLAKDVKANDILKHLLETSGNDYNSITNIFKYHDQIKFSDQTDSFNEFLDDVLSKRKEPVLHSITIKEGKLGISDLGIFKSDKLKTFTKDAVGYSTLMNNVKQIHLEIPCSDTQSIITVNQMKTKTKVKKKDIYNTITGSIEMKENRCHFAMESKNDKNKIKQMAEKELEILLQKTIRESKEIGSDIFGYQDLLYKKNPTIISFSFKDLTINNQVKLSTKKLNDKGVYHE